MEEVSEIKESKANLENSKFYLSSFWWLNLFFSLLINSASWGLIYWRIKPSSLPIFLHYNIYFGIDLVGQWYQLYYYAAAGFLIIILNFTLAALVYRQQKVAMYFLGASTIILQLFLGFLILLLININL